MKKALPRYTEWSFLALSDRARQLLLSFFKAASIPCRPLSLGFLIYGLLIIRFVFLQFEIVSISSDFSFYFPTMKRAIFR